METNNDILSAVILMERVLPRLKENSREPIKKSQLNQISQFLVMTLKKLNGNGCDNVLILTPMMEVLSLITEVMEDPTFVETDADTKNIMVTRLHTAMEQLYLYAGKFYMANEFEYSMTQNDVLRHIVDACMDMGFYFGYDAQLMREGLILSLHERR